MSERPENKVRLDIDAIVERVLTEVLALTAQHGQAAQPVPTVNIVPFKRRFAGSMLNKNT
jgi:hypothetical protein